MAKTGYHCQMAKHLPPTGWLHLPRFLTPSETRVILEDHSRLDRFPRKRLGINDSEDETNTCYASLRSPGVSYTYLASPRSRALSQGIATRLGFELDYNWLSGINRHCLPIFSYAEGAAIAAHRGRDFGFGRNDLVAVAMLTEQGKDFAGGEFYLNENADASPDGKRVYNNFERDRQVFNLERGDVLIFENPRFVHATYPTRAVEGNPCLRATCSWRIET